mgnify:FL=1
MNLKKYLALLSVPAIVLLISYRGQTVENFEANSFPTIHGKNLNKVKKTVPDDFVDKNLIAILAFQQWHQPIVDESIRVLETHELDQDFNIIEVPTIAEFTKLGQMYLDGTMRAAIKDDFIRNRTITVYLNKESLREALEIPNENEIYWFVIKKDSNEIIFRGVGVIQESDIEDIKNLS